MSTDGGFIKKFRGIVLTSEEDEYTTLLPVINKMNTLQG
jgi:hypothetical protein